MKIIDMVNANFPNAASHQVKSQTSNAFDMFLAEAGQRQNNEPAVENQNRNRDDGTRSRRSDGEPRRESRPAAREEIQANETESTAATAVITEQTNEEVYETVVDEAQVIEKVAEVMQVPPEVVEEWLNELELTAQDLKETQNVTKVLQLAYEAETPAELLTEPKFPENYKAVNEAMAELVAEAKPKAVVNTETLASAEEAVATLAETMEELDAVIEDGEVIVTNGSESSATSRTQSSTQTAEQTETAETNALGTETTDNALLTKEDAVVNESPTINPAISVDAAAAKIEQAVRQAASQQPVNATEVIEQIMNQVKMTAAGGNFNEIRMTLRPETLGDIVLRVLTQNGIVMAQFEAESQRVKEALEANFNQLRDSLQEAGITFSELSVSVRQDGNERMNQFERARQNSRHRAGSIEEVSEEQAEISHHNGVINLTA
ncbi:MAG: flagellar hook-length control protein FliK [Defluviitaleaceae bacterium]|nr:flagellar hook-length control protein FliK [Defluviitaleaceae bacterium]